MQAMFKRVLSFVLASSFAMLASSAFAATPVTHSQLIPTGQSQAHLKAPNCKKNPKAPGCKK